MNATLPEPANNAQLELDLPALLMRLDANKIALWSGWPLRLYPITRISPAMADAIHRHADDLHDIAEWWGIKTCIRDAPTVFQ